MRKRFALLALLIVAGFLVVIVRLADIMLVNHTRFLVKAVGQQTKKEFIPVKRGIIVDRKGRELAINLETESLYCDPAEVVSPERVASTLSRAMNNRNPDRIRAKLTAGNRFNWIERKLESGQAQRIRELKLKGIGFVPDMKRFYPKGTLASHLIGYVGIDNNGLEGIERKYDGYLSARGEKVSVQRDAKGNVLSEGTVREIRGNNIVLTIDEGLQYIVEKNLDAAMEQWKAASATAIMMDPYSGELLALASRPHFDLNNPAGVTAAQRRNRSITDCYEPGSTFKIVVGMAALEEGLVSPDTKFDCSAGSIEVGGRKIRDAHRHGVLSFKEVIQKSSNVGSIKLGLALGRDKVYQYVKKFGFGEKTGIDLTGEVSGWIRPPARWSGMSIGAISIGQEVAVTPLQVLRAYAMVA
ncbi:MAG: penicillin-binding protein 2, partial [Nitrospirales bacterium]|nr:penicillin-binding protein 2 [Nitrospirales bacterium]